ncbi:hypothetical protein DL96DRAFT_1824805 [Flagelloscypha sp. PMI_526]|nr:hypothetical protein DL96DRAFT_1824805 [Flagelloscypha sp. PMI_526]
MPIRREHPQDVSTATSANNQQLDLYPDPLTSFSSSFVMSHPTFPVELLYKIADWLSDFGDTSTLRNWHLLRAALCLMCRSFISARYIKAYREDGHSRAPKSIGYKTRSYAPSQECHPKPARFATDSSNRSTPQIAYVEKITILGGTYWPDDSLSSSQFVSKRTFSWNSISRSMAASLYLWAKTLLGLGNSFFETLMNTSQQDSRKFSSPCFTRITPNKLCCRACRPISQLEVIPMDLRPRIFHVRRKSVIRVASRANFDTPSSFDEDRVTLPIQTSAKLRTTWIAPVPHFGGPP